MTTRPGRLPGEGSNPDRPAPAPRPGLGPRRLDVTGWAKTTTSTTSSPSRRPPGPNSGLGGLSQLLSPAAAGGRVMRTCASPPPRPSAFASGRRRHRGRRPHRGRRHRRPRRRTRSTSSTPSAPGLFTGAAVDVLGVKVGTVTEVQNVGDTGARHARREPGHQGPDVGLRLARGRAAAGVARRRPQPRLHRRGLPRRPGPPSPRTTRRCPSRPTRCSRSCSTPSTPSTRTRWATSSPTSPPTSTARAPT